MIHIKTTQKLAFSIVFCILAACSSDTSEPNAPWEVLEADQEPTEEAEQLPQPVELIERGVSIEACAPDFLMGSVWHRIPDQEATLNESEWIVTLTTSLPAIAYDLYQQDSEWNEANYDYSPQLSELKTTLASLDIEILREDDAWRLVVAGKPSRILEAIKTSCHIRMMDMTGFHCDCAPEQCIAARSCALRATQVPTSFEPLDNDEYFRVSASGHNDGYLGCLDDFEFGDLAVRTSVDFRGVGWFVDGMRSWQNSSCTRPREPFYEMH